MKTQDSSHINIRYGVAPIIILLGLWLLLAASLDNLLIIGIILLPSILLIMFRPFLIICGEDISYVALLSNKFTRQVSREDLIEKLPSMRWFLRKSDLLKLEQDFEMSSDETSNKV